LLRPKGVFIANKKIRPAPSAWRFPDKRQIDCGNLSQSAHNRPFESCCCNPAWVDCTRPRSQRTGRCRTPWPKAGRRVSMPDC